MIIGQTVKLRAVNWEDQEQIVKWRNDPGVYKWFFGDGRQTLAEQKSWFRCYLQRADEKLFMIVTLDDRPLGTVGLTQIDLHNGKAYLGRFYIGSKEDRGKTYGPEAEWLLLGHCFDRLNLNKVYVEVFAFNKTVIRLHKAFGFKEEGTLREDISHEGKYEDVVMMSLLWREYEDAKFKVNERLGRLCKWVASA